MAEPFLGEVRLFSFNFAPSGWAQCNGQLLPINQNQALYTLLGTSFGGDGINTFGLPDLRGRVPIHPVDGSVVGATGGEERHVLTIDEIPPHTHQANGSSEPSTVVVAAQNVWGTTGTLNVYHNAINGAMSANALANAGASVGHANMQPYTVVNFCIALQGIFPPRS
ncbi:phage tail protein [Paenibacillus flagellatus]|uniref:Phage tail protein n=1 Tax=Paenibacillus flagellatus TaxID=2211139 RepID=A0A2V5KA98_9BACL|nr:tail fiber protein [Paenibacillus flagellatus]PYI56515.1 phage tail protein [Paenibacillus flagellatus]